MHSLHRVRRLWNTEGAARCTDNVGLSVSLSVCLSVYLSVRLVCLSLRLSVCLSVCASVCVCWSLSAIEYEFTNKGKVRASEKKVSAKDL